MLLCMVRHAPFKACVERFSQEEGRIGLA